MILSGGRRALGRREWDGKEGMPTSWRPDTLFMSGHLPARYSLYDHHTSMRLLSTRSAVEVSAMYEADHRIKDDRWEQLGRWGCDTRRARTLILTEAL